MAKYDKSKKYWLQLREDWFEEDSIKWLESQKNGKEYSLFYMKLMVKSIKTNGYLIRQVGKLLIPYDSVAISELTRTDVDTVVVAMNLLKEIGLVEILEDGAIFIEAVEKMIGSTTISAIKKQEQLKRREENLVGWNKGGKNSTKDITITKTITKDIIKERFKKPTVEEVKEYCLERKNNVNAESFVDFYESKGWKIGKNSMKDWRASVRTWERGSNNNVSGKKEIEARIKTRDYDKEQLSALYDDLEVVEI